MDLEASPRAGFLSRRALAERTSLSAACLSRVENGTSLLSLPEIDEWASAVGTDTDAHARLHQLAEAAHTPAVEAFRHGGPDLQRSVLDLEARAGHVLTVQPTIVPALLQTVAYARAVLELADVTSQDIAAAVALRLRRQELLHDLSKRFQAHGPRGPQVPGGRPSCAFPFSQSR
ncbi:Scr1 family TA system antitoxin-like transcriptional regulator [Parafrankia sp. FMc2]|uniref:Scr1 family TA system antitoxin-like transcriptional regulator n=1 Tax=Parafrankia sp. FMc2 TaxID=3233196 RepID=UPI0034D6C04C